MKDDNYFNAFLDHDEIEALQTKPIHPPWVSNKNSSAAAYDAIQKIFKRKKLYIKAHTQKKDFANKSLYQISKVEVAEQIGVKMQPIFHSVNYKEALTAELNARNEDLQAAKQAKLERHYSGNKAKTKETLIKELRDAKTRDKTISQSTTDEVLSLTLERIPLDVKRRLMLA